MLKASHLVLAGGMPGEGAWQTLTVRSSAPVISLFSGAGGLDLGVERCGDSPLSPGASPGPYHIALSIDSDESAAGTLQKNFSGVILNQSISSTTTEELLALADLSVGEPALVVGGPPCTPFSKSGFWLDYKRESRDPKASLLDEFSRVVREARPEGFILENVQGLAYRTHSEALDRLIAKLNEAGYNPIYKVLNAADYGVPQLRKRLFVIGRRDGRSSFFPSTTHSGWSEHSKRKDEAKNTYVTARDAFADLLTPEEPPDLAIGRFSGLLANVPPGGNYLYHTDRGLGAPEFRWRSRYWTFLLRLDPDRPSSTIQAQPGPWVGPFHWENVDDSDGVSRARRLNLAELRRLMTFPDDYQFAGDPRSVRRQIGNGVPVELAKAVARSLAEQLGHF